VIETIYQKPGFVVERKVEGSNQVRYTLANQPLLSGLEEVRRDTRVILTLKKAKASMRRLVKTVAAGIDNGGYSAHHPTLATYDEICTPRVTKKGIDLKIKKVSPLRQNGGNKTVIVLIQGQLKVQKLPQSQR
jgi:hypothetical protein